MKFGYLSVMNFVIPSVLIYILVSLNVSSPGNILKWKVANMWHVRAWGYYSFPGGFTICGNEWNWPFHSKPCQFALSLLSGRRVAAVAHSLHLWLVVKGSQFNSRCRPTLGVVGYSAATCTNSWPKDATWGSSAKSNHCGLMIIVMWRENKFDCL